MIGVGEFCDIIGFGINYFALWEIAIAVALIILGCAFQFAVAVILDSYHNFIAGFVVGDARNTAAVLGNEVSVFTCGIEFQLLIAADGGSLIQVVDGCGGTGRQGGIAITAQGKVEGIRFVPSAALQLFFDLEQFFGFRRVRCCVVGVYKLGFAVFGVGVAIFNLGFQIVIFQCNLDGGGDIRGLGHAGDISRFVFRNGVGVSTRLVVGDFTEIGGLIAAVCRYGCVVVGGHRGTVRCRKGKGERIVIVPLTADNALAYAQRGRGFTFKGVGEGQVVGNVSYLFPRIVLPLIVGGRDAQGIRFRTLGRNNSLNQVLLCAVSNSGRITPLFGKQVIIGVTTVCTQRVGDISKGNCTSRIVDGACHAIFFVSRHGDCGAARPVIVVFVFRCGFEIEVELTGGQGHRLVVSIFVDFLGLNIECLGVILKGVGKRDPIRFYTIFRNGVICHFQLAAAVVRDSNRHTVEGAVIRNTGDFTYGGDILGDVVHIRAGFGEGDTLVELKGNLISVVGEAISIPHVCRYIFHTVFQRGTIDSHQFEIEMIVLVPIAARQNLYALERVIRIRVLRVHGNRGGVIGVCHRDFLGCTCRDLARAVVRNARGVACGRGFFRDGIGAACGQAYNLGSLVFFQGESIAALDGFSTLNTGNGVVVAGIGVQARARQLKLHRKFGVSVRVQTLVGYHILGNFQAACGVHGQLTVVAKVQHTLVCVKIPLEVNAAFGGAGFVTTIFLFLIAQLVINGGGQAAFFGARLDVAVAIFFWNDVLIDFLLSFKANRHPTGLDNRISMRRRFQLQIVQLVVVGLFRLYLCGLRILCVCTFTRFGVQQGILGVIVEVVACCRGKGGSGRADGFVRIKFVGVEADFAAFSVFRNVGGKVVVGKAAGRNLVAHIFIKADRVDDADGLGVVDFQLLGAIGVCDLIIPQGQHTGRDLDLHTVALCDAAMGDGDNDVAQIGCLGVGTADRVVMLARKGIGIHIAGAFYARLRKDFVGKGNGLKAFDFHIIAQGIIESHVAVCFGFVRNMRGACQFGRYGIEDALKDRLQPISAGSRHIVICFVRFVAEVPTPVTTPPLIYMRVSGKGVVAGDRLHEFVFT